MRTRYAIAFYLVIFGSIIVAAYKMGMVHENDVTTPGHRPLKQTPSATSSDVRNSETPTTPSPPVLQSPPLPTTSNQ